MNPRLFGVRILLIFLGSTWAREKPNTNFRILISRAFTSINQIFTPTNSTGDRKQNMILSHLIDLLEKKFAFEKFWNIFPPNIFIWIHSSQFSPNIELTINLLKITAKIKLSQYFELIPRTCYFDPKEVFNSKNLYNEMLFNFCWKWTRMNPCSGGRFGN